ncbi:MAG: hypothetical protein ACRBEE_15430 [Arenicella sp.]
MRKKILFVPGKNPKPDPQKHIHYLRRCLLEGVSRHSPQVAEEILEQNAFELCAWNHDFYQQHLDFSPLLNSLDDVCRKNRATAKDKIFAQTWKIAISRMIYQIGDQFPWLIDWLADDHVKAMMHDTDRYFDNVEGIADKVRRTLAESILDCTKHCKILVVGHSMGSIIAFDTLFELQRRRPNEKLVDVFLTLGSPLGLKYTQERLLGFSRSDPEKLPANIQTWHNVSAKGDLVSVDTQLANDFGLMKKAGLIDDIIDHKSQVFNWYRNLEGYNFHSSYGYLVEPTASKIISDWWLRHSSEEEKNDG